MAYSAEDIAEHPNFVEALRDFAASLRQQFDDSPRLSRMLASHQRWLLSQAAFALQLEYDPSQPGSGLTTTNLREIITSNNAASRNTVLNFLDQLLSYKFVRIVGDPTRRPKRYEATEVTYQAVYLWLLANLLVLDRLDGGDRVATLRGRPGIVAAGPAADRATRLPGAALARAARVSPCSSGQRPAASSWTNWLRRAVEPVPGGEAYEIGASMRVSSPSNS